MRHLPKLVTVNMPKPNLRRPPQFMARTGRLIAYAAYAVEKNYIGQASQKPLRLL